MFLFVCFIGLLFLIFWLGIGSLVSMFWLAIGSLVLIVWLAIGSSYAEKSNNLFLFIGLLF